MMPTGDVRYWEALRSHLWVVMFHGFKSYFPLCQWHSIAIRWKILVWKWSTHYLAINAGRDPLVWSTKTLRIMTVNLSESLIPTQLVGHIVSQGVTRYYSPRMFGSLRFSDRRIVALHTTEARMIVSMEVFKQQKLINKFFELTKSVQKPWTLYCNNQHCVKIALHTGYHGR